MMTMEWVQRFLEAAEHRATFSKDPSTKTGAVVVAPDGKSDVVYGYNGYPKGVQDKNLDDRSFKYPRIIHAEANSILRAKTDLEDHYMLCTLAPCATCAGFIIQSGIKCVYHIQEEFEKNDRWVESHLIALDMFQEAGVECYGVYSEGIRVNIDQQVDLCLKRLDNEQ